MVNAQAVILLAFAVAGVLFVRANFETWITHVSKDDNHESENPLINLFKIFNS